MKRKLFKSRALRAHVDDEFTAIVPAPFGAVGIQVQDGVLQGLTCLPPQTPKKLPADPVSKKAAQQVKKYFSQPDFHFDLPMAVSGTDFQRRVWDEIAAIPAGETATYGELARRLNTAPRAVGQACANNRLALAIPCHRVVGAKGVGGFFGVAEGAGSHTRTKRWLLQHEGCKLNP